MTVDTEKLRALAQAATPGPWVVDDTKVDLLANNPDCPDEWFCFGGAAQPSDAAYIAAAHPAAVLALLDEVERLREALTDIASGKYSGQLLMSLPPQDPAVNRAKAALSKGAP